MDKQSHKNDLLLSLQEWETKNRNVMKLLSLQKWWTENQAAMKLLSKSDQKQLIEFKDKLKEHLNSAPLSQNATETTEPPTEGSKFKKLRDSLRKTNSRPHRLNWGKKYKNEINTLKTDEKKELKRIHIDLNKKSDAKYKEKIKEPSNYPSWYYDEKKETTTTEITGKDKLIAQIREFSDSLEQKAYIIKKKKSECKGYLFDATEDQLQKFLDVLREK